MTIIESNDVGVEGLGGGNWDAVEFAGDRSIAAPKKVLSPTFDATMILFSRFPATVGRIFGSE
jgi:hypothetical protein